MEDHGNAAWDESAAAAADLLHEVYAQGHAEGYVAGALEAHGVGLDDDLVESLADYAHESWSGWMRYLFSKTTPCADGAGCVLPEEYVTRWQRQLATRYAALSEGERESDRDEARMILAIVGEGRKSEDLPALQAKVAAWADYNFPETAAVARERCTLGVAEEAGELAEARINLQVAVGRLAHSVLKQAQGIRGSVEEHEEAAKDAIGDIVVFLLHLCHSQKWSFAQIVTETVNSVTQRNWRDNPTDGAATAPSADATSTEPGAGSVEVP